MIVDCVFRQTAQGENGPTKTDGQRQHYHRHGQGKERAIRAHYTTNTAQNSQTQNTVYEIVSDMSGRQDAVEERLSGLEDKIQAMQVRS